MNVSSDLHDNYPRKYEITKTQIFHWNFYKNIQISHKFWSNVNFRNRCL